MSESKTPVLELTTAVEEAALFTVDGEEFKLLGFQHLNADQEAEVMANIARMDRLQVNLELTNDDKEAKTIARRLRDKRLALLSELTSLTVDQAASLPLPEQVKLVKAIQREAGIGGEADGES